MKKIQKFIQRTIFISLPLLLILNFFNPLKKIFLILPLILILLLYRFITKKKLLITSTISLSLYFALIITNLSSLFLILEILLISSIITNTIKPITKIPPATYTLIPLLIILNLIWLTLLPSIIPQTYTLNVGTPKDTNPRSELYLESNMLSPPKSYGEQTWREFEKDGNFNLNLNTKTKPNLITLELEYNSSSPIFTNQKIIYDPSWKNFQKIASFKEDNIFLDPQILENHTNKKFENIENFNSTPKLINSTFRGSLIFEGYFKNKIDLKFLKRDRNQYLGSDELTLKISKNNITYFQKNITGDKITNINNASNFKPYYYSFNILNGFYKIELLYPKKGADVEISNITLNTNKLITKSELIILKPTTIYLKNNTKPIKFELPHINTNQQILFIGENNKTLNLTSELANEKTILNPSEYTSFKITKGDIHITSAQPLSFWANGSYQKPTPEQIFFQTTDINEFIKKNFNETNQIYDSTNTIKTKNLNSNNFEKYYSEFENYENPAFTTHIINTSFRGEITLLGYFNNSINITLTKKDLNLYEGPEEITINITNSTGHPILSKKIPDNGQINATKKPISQKINLYLNNTKKGFYTISITSPENIGNDYEISALSFNSNKIVTQNNILIREPATIYIQNLNNIRYRYWHNIEQNFKIDNETQQITFKNELINKWQKINTQNKQTIQIEKGNLMFSAYANNIAYWKEGTIQNQINPQIILSQSNDLSKKNSIKIKTKQTKINIVGEEKTKIYQIKIKNE